MDLIINKTNNNHSRNLKNLIRNSEKILIAVAFLKNSGLDLVKDDLEIALKNNANIKMYFGLDFYFTEPDALRKLLVLFKKYRRGNLYLYKSGKEAFHPKLYCFIKSKTVYILTGSINFTKGGFQENIEVSTLEKTMVGSSIYKKVISFFDAIERDSIEANEIDINLYKREYDIIHKKLNKASREAENEIKTITKLDIPKIKKHLVEYKKNKEEQDDFKERLINYKKAKNILDKICNNSITSKKEFMNYYERLIGKKGQSGLWHSDGLFRHKVWVAPKYKTFIKMACEIRNNIKKHPKEVFEIGLKYLKKVKGLGVNTLTEIMNTFAPKKFAVLNNNPVTSLKFLGFSVFPNPNNFKPDVYDLYNSLISEFMKICGFKSLGQVDHFLNYIYWKYAKK
ncbi:MAG: hypothetical protein B5M53_01545 [Candidatus Cloacimonas sp. 4484_209]|nr:MAG: hypothetical protein B5M53_01545 [Candidatus Cloacimonas sp. 4484_209]